MLLSLNARIDASDVCINFCETKEHLIGTAGRKHGASNLCRMKRQSCLFLCFVYIQTVYLYVQMFSNVRAVMKRHSA